MNVTARLRAVEFSLDTWDAEFGQEQIGGRHFRRQRCSSESGKGEAGEAPAEPRVLMDS